MRQTIILLGLLFNSMVLNAQINLVRNPSFEEHWRCPDNVDELEFANFWSPIDTITTYPALHDTFGNYHCNPEYINECSSYFGASAPANAYFYQYPRSGAGMAQGYMFFDSSYPGELYQRDYIMGRLFHLLDSGRQYCVTFYTVFEGTNGSIPSGYAVNNIGAYLDDGSLSLDTGIICGLPHPSIIPQVYTTSIVTDTLNWTKIQGTMIANGKEKYITLGNFFDKAHTSYFRVSGDNRGMYLFDDVSVIAFDDTANAGPDQNIPYGSTDSVQVGDTTGYLPCYWYKNGILIDSNKAGFKVFPDTTSYYVMQLDVCGNITTDTVVVHVGRVGIGNLNPDFIRLFPNPVKDKLVIENAFGCTLTIKNLLGKVVLQTEVISGKQIVEISALPNGVYFAEITEKATSNRVVKKIVKE